MNKKDAVEKIKNATSELTSGVQLPEFRKKAEVPPQIKIDSNLSSLEDPLKKSCMDIIADTFSVRTELLNNNATADTGLLGFFNQKARKRREKKYFQKVLNGFDGIKVVSEGDSWYQYPVFVKDTIDWISEDPDFAVYSLGSGGDWLANILEEGEYIEALPIYRPDFFLISGAGNDLLENFRVAALLKDGDAIQSQKAQDLILQDFYDLIVVFKYLFVKMFLNLADRFPNLQILVHGYGYAIPAAKKGGSLIQFLSHNIVGQGIWLHTPLLLRNIRTAELQREIVRIMIDAFNEMLSELSITFSHVHHIDLRELIGENDWHDEIHPNSATFKKISEAFTTKMKMLYTSKAQHL